MTSKAKKIDVGDGYAVQFLQRARGEETPYWVGLIFKDGKRVGDFKNDGRGGMTFIYPNEVVEAFRKLVDEAVPGVSIKHERESIVLTFAECKGYFRDGRILTLADVVRVYVREIAS